MQLDQINKQEIIQATDECVMCGLCLPHCPTYKVAKSEPESPRGRIALVRGLYEEQLQANENIHSHLDHCLTCLKCETVCPANVDYEKIIDAGRAITRPQQRTYKKFQQSFLAFALSNPYARKFFKIAISTIYALRLHSLLKELRLFSLIPSEIQKNFDHAPKPQQGPKVALLNSCANDLINDGTLSASTFLLSKLGCELINHEETHCCGALHQHSGDIQNATALKDKLIDAFQTGNVDYFASLATGCGAYITKYAHKLNGEFVDINELIFNLLEHKKIQFKPFPEKVFIHTPCSQEKVFEDIKLVERLLNFIPEIEIITFHGENTCCGAGGLNSLTYSELANELIKDKVQQVKLAGTTYLLSSNIGCALHFQARFRQEHIPIQVCHPVTLLAQQVI